MKVSVYKQIHATFASASSNDAWMKREVELPFPPFLGLHISGPGEFWADIIEIIFYPESGETRCYTKSDDTIYTRMMVERRNRISKEDRALLERLVFDHEKAGWTRT